MDVPLPHPGSRGSRDDGCAASQSGGSAVIHGWQAATMVSLLSVAVFGSMKLQRDPVRYGRDMVVQHDCGACHGGGTNPAAQGWLAGVGDTSEVTMIGPLKTYARNITPDEATGIGRYTERQIFNALRFG